MRKPLILALVGVGLVASLTACGESATDDRQGGAGSKADQTTDTDHVTVYRNADNVPNVAYFCAGGFAWASTLSGGDSGDNKAATIVRFPDYDSHCDGASR